MQPNTKTNTKDSDHSEWAKYTTHEWASIRLWSHSSDALLNAWCSELTDSDILVKAGQLFFLGTRPVLFAQVVGMVVGIMPGDSKCTYLVDDGTAVLDCRIIPSRNSAPSTSIYKLETSTKQGAGASTAPEIQWNFNQVGDIVRVAGRVEESYGERRLAVDKLETVPPSVESEHHITVSYRIQNNEAWSKERAFANASPKKRRKISHIENSREEGDTEDTEQKREGEKKLQRRKDEGSRTKMARYIEPEKPLKLTKPDKIRSSELDISHLRLYILQHMKLNSSSSELSHSNRNNPYKFSQKNRSRQRTLFTLNSIKQEPSLKKLARRIARASLANSNTDTSKSNSLSISNSLSSTATGSKQTQPTKPLFQVAKQGRRLIGNVPSNVKKINIEGVSLSINNNNNNNNNNNTASTTAKTGGLNPNSNSSLLTPAMESKLADRMFMKTIKELCDDGEIGMLESNDEEYYRNGDGGRDGDKDEGSEKTQEREDQEEDEPFGMVRKKPREDRYYLVRD